MLPADFILGELMIVYAARKYRIALDGDEDSLFSIALVALFSNTARKPGRELAALMSALLDSRGTGGQWIPAFPTSMKDSGAFYILIQDWRLTGEAAEPASLVISIIRWGPLSSFCANGPAALFLVRCSMIEGQHQAYREAWLYAVKGLSLDLPRRIKSHLIEIFTLRASGPMIYIRWISLSSRIESMWRRGGSAIYQPKPTFGQTARQNEPQASL